MWGFFYFSPTELTMKVIRVSKHTHEPTPDDVYIGRGSPFGNPFSHLPSKYPDVTVVETRDEACNKYEIWADDQLTKNTPFKKGMITLLNRLKKGKPVVLVCFCPLHCRCHGDYVRTLLIDAYKRTVKD